MAGFFESLLPVAGAVGGFFLGGPSGAAAGAALGGAVSGGLAQQQAASQASDAQIQAAQTASAQQQAASDAAIAEQRRQFDLLQRGLAPYQAAGESGLGGIQSILGLRGAGAEQEQINAVLNSPTFAAMQQQGENAILSNASATGGLRGGNTQAALAQFRPALLSQLLNERFSRLGGLASMGGNAAAGVGNAGMGMAGNVGNILTGTAGNIGNLTGTIGAAQAGRSLAEGRAYSGLANLPMQALGLNAATGGRLFDMGGSAPQLSSPAFAYTPSMGIM